MRIEDPELGEKIYAEIRKRDDYGGLDSEDLTFQKRWGWAKKVSFEDPQYYLQRQAI